MIRVAAPIALLAAAAAANPAAAQVSEAIIAEASGPMLVLPVDGSPGCRIDLMLAPTIGGRVARPSANCAERLPSLAQSAAWYLDDGVHLLDAVRAPTMTFTSDETGLLSSPSVSDPAHYLVPWQKGLTRAPTTQSVVGRWRLRGPRWTKPCTLDLGPATANDGGMHRLTLGKGCAQKGITYWRIEALTLFLEGPGDRQLAFAANSDAGFVGPRGLKITR